MMAEAYTGANTYCDIMGQTLGFEGRIIKQISSDLYDHINPFRYEFSTGLVVQDKIKLSLKYVSPYLAQDNVRQILADVSIYFGAE